MAGYSETTQHWSNERYEIWGEEYIWANKGRFPSADALSDAARNRIGPSQGGVRNRYSSISAYHDTLEARFSEKFNKYMDDIVSGITENRLPIDLIAHTKSEWVVAKRFLKYSLLENVYPDLSVLEKTAIYHLLNDYAGYRLAKDRPDIDISRLEEEARKQGVYAAIWPKRSGLIRLEKRKSTARQFIADTGKLNQISRRGIQAKKVRRPSIGSVPVLDTKLLENGFVLNVLAPSPRAEPIRPDSEQAKSIIKRVRDTRFKQSYTIFSAARD
jgi:hypothetical protein